MNLLKIPYPKVSFKTFFKVMLLIGLSVVFILTVLQPFGTAGFKHEYKILLLSGYGIVIFLVGIIYYWIVELIISSRMKDRWTIVHEVLYLFANVLMSLVGCYLYYGLVLSSKLSLNRFFEFLLLSGSVAILPVGAYLLYIYGKFKEVRYLDNLTNSIEDTIDKKDEIKLTGSNEKEKLVVNADNLLYVKSNDNYVIIYMLEDGKLSKKMLRNTLNKINDLTGEKLIKCHRSYLVNTSKIVDIEGNITNSKLSILGSDQKIPVSRSNVEVFRKMMASA